jgi:hypothetical protein
LKEKHNRIVAPLDGADVENPLVAYRLLVAQHDERGILLSAPTRHFYDISAER